MLKEVIKWWNKKPQEVEEKFFYYARISKWEVTSFIFKSKRELPLDGGIFSKNEYTINKAFNEDKNIFQVIYIEPGDSLLKLSKCQYKERLKNNICNCEIGNGSNIVRHSKPYDVDEIELLLQKRYPELKVKKGSPAYIDIKSNKLSFIIFYLNEFKTIYIKKQGYYKKACLNCGACLDEIKYLYFEFEEQLRKIDKEKKKKEIEDQNNKLIDDICHG